VDSGRREKVRNVAYFRKVSERLSRRVYSSSDISQTFTYGFWREYSAMAHATFEGLLPAAIYFTPGDVPHEQRDIFHTKGQTG